MSRTLLFVTLAMIMMGGLGVYGWMQIRHVDTGGFLYVFVGLANALGLLWNNVATAKVRDRTDTIGVQVTEIAQNGHPPR